MSRVFFFLIFCFLFNKNIIKCNEGLNNTTHKDGFLNNGTTGDDGHTGGNVPPRNDFNKPDTPTRLEDTKKTTGEKDLKDPKVPEEDLKPAKDAPFPNEATPTLEKEKENEETLKKNLQVPIKSALLKKDKGIKIVGSCGQYFQLNFVPHFSFSVDTKFSKLTLDQKFIELGEMNVQFEGTCLEAHTFKMVVKLKNDILTIKWAVKDASGNKEYKDIKKFKVPELDRPITSIQVHTSKGGDIAIESKNYNLRDNIPETCDAITTECFLSGHFDIEKCFHCTALVRQDDKCLDFVSPDGKSEFEKSIGTIAQDDEDSVEYKLRESATKILKKTLKKDHNKKRKLITEKELDDELKEELLKYCNLLKEIDTSETFLGTELGNPEEIFNNLVTLLKLNIEENDFTLKDKLKNAAICIKNAKEWADHKRGLKLTDEENKYYNEIGDGEVDFANELYENEKTFTKNSETNEDNVIDLTKRMKLSAPYYVKNKYCNDQYCDRWKDRTSCLAKIEVEDQGKCGICWIFASKLHFETIRCMRGHGYFKSSPLFVANCSKRREDKCVHGSDAFEFLSIISEQKFLPLESDYPYARNKVNQPCPYTRHKWTNLWGTTELLKSRGRVTSTNGFYIYSSHSYRNNIDAFIRLIKLEIQNKGSVIVYIKTKGVLEYYVNGKDVEMLCGDGTVDHAATIIGYGNYISKTGEKRSYWLIRNSWGYHWGDRGNIKVDMHGPKNCYNNFIHIVFTFKINLGMIEVPHKKQPDSLRFFARNSPYFYHQLYFMNFDEDRYKYAQEEKSRYNRYRKRINNLDDVNEFNKVHVEDNFNNEGVVHGEDEDNEEIPVEGNVNQEEIKHSLKDINKNVIKTNLVTYSNENDMSSDYSCSRVYSYSGEFDEQCKQFCKENLDKCKQHYLPGYCLTKLKGTNECFFCSV